MRGKVRMYEGKLAMDRITPAYAGKSLNSTLILFMIKDHPRLCGEKRKLSRLLIFSLGSPPPMRGKGGSIKAVFAVVRITPAYAGKSLKRRMRQLGCQDHPRLCGEKKCVCQAALYTVGSPPPMRGKAPFSKSKPTFTRITPAYAGKSVGAFCVMPA